MTSAKVFILICIHLLRRQIRWVTLVAFFLPLLVFTQIKFGHLLLYPTIREGFVGTYQEHDIPDEVIKLTSQSLVEIKEDGKIKPVLVSGWETNNDATIFKFKLKDNLVWSDGTKLKSSDLEFNIPQTEVTYPDEKIIQFKLKEPYSPLASLLTRPIIKKGTLIGTGPYRISKIEKSRIFITKIEMSSSLKDLPKVFIRFYPNEKVAMTGFNLGEIQVLFGLNDPKLIGDNPGVSFRQKTDFKKIVTILYHTQNELLSNRSVRQALSFQTPKIEGEETANNPFPKSSWAYDPDAKDYLSNPDEAKEALERAKIALSGKKLREEIILTSTPNLEETAQKVVAEWEKLGFDVKLRLESGIPQNFQSLLITQSIPSDPDQYFLWHSSQERTNLTKYSSARVDKDLEDGRKVITEEDRKTKYYDFQKTLLEDAPATFLYFPKYNVVYLKRVEPLLDKVFAIQLQCKIFPC